MYISGDLKVGDSEKLRSIVLEDPMKFVRSPVVLNSNGGNIAEALRIADLVKAAYLEAAVPKKSVCASACFYILAAATTRYMNGEVGIHRPYLTKEIAEKKNIVEMELIPFYIN